MADRVESFAVTIPHGTTKSAPRTVDISFAAGVVAGVEILVPAGHAGFTGIALAQAGAAVIPITDGQFIVSDDEVIHWPIDGAINNGDWQAIGYNTGTFDHTFYIRFLITEIGEAPAGEPLPAGTIST